MKATRKHKDNSSRQARQSSYHYRISKAVKAVAIIIGAVIGIALWAIAKPILRAVGWLISILSAIGAIYWLLTLKNIYDYGNELNERNTGVPRHNRPIPYGKG